MAIPQIGGVKPAVLPPVAGGIGQPIGSTPNPVIGKPPQMGAQTKPMNILPPQQGKPMQYGTNPAMQTDAKTPNNMPMSNLSSQTPAGLQGNINNQRYDAPPRPNQEGDLGGQWGGNSNLYGNSSRPPKTAGQNTQGFGNFDQFRDSALAQAMRGLNPRIDSQNAAFEQQMVGRGIQPGTAQYDAQRMNLDRRNSDLLSQAEYGAQQQGLAAQQQDWNQNYQYDALANALDQANIGAQASMSNSRNSMNASMYGSDASMANAQLANALGYSRLNETGRQFDVNDIFRTQGQDINAALGFGQLGLGQQGADLNAFNANQNAQNQWWNQIGGMTSNAPGVMFRPTDNVASQMQNAGQNMYDAQGAQNSALGGLLGAGMSMLPFSDKRLKENIVKVGRVDDVNVYEFDYIDKSLGVDRYRGVMAQEIEEDYPDAVLEFSGFKMVDYSKLPVDMETV